MVSNRASLDDFYSFFLEEGVIRNKNRTQSYLDFLFNGIDFYDARVLDVGCGRGMLSAYAACRGARQVIGLEPEAEGSRKGAGSLFENMRAELGLLDQIFLESVTLQSFEPGNRRFDVVLLHNSVNHLDEHACIHLHEDENAREVYRKIFAKIGFLSEPGAKLFIRDCSRYNFFALMGMRNPLAPTIEYHKHQAPEIWVSLLQEADFYNQRVRWTSFVSGYFIGRVMAGNRLASYFLTSHFCLTMDKR